MGWTTRLGCRSSSVNQHLCAHIAIAKKHQQKVGCKHFLALRVTGLTSPEPCVCGDPRLQGPRSGQSVQACFKGSPNTDDKYLIFLSMLWPPCKRFWLFAGLTTPEPFVG